MAQSARITNIAKWLKTRELDSAQIELPSSDQTVEILKGQVRQLRLSEATMLLALENANAEFNQALQASHDREQRLMDLVEKFSGVLRADPERS